MLLLSTPCTLYGSAFLAHIQQSGSAFFAHIQTVWVRPGTGDHVPVPAAAPLLGTKGSALGQDDAKNVNAEVEAKVAAWCERVLGPAILGLVCKGG